MLLSAIRLSTPLIFAALGGLFSERSGVINIALEGLMLAGAFTAAVATYELHNPFLGMFCGPLMGGAIAAHFGFEAVFLAIGAVTLANLVWVALSVRTSEAGAPIR